jgi:hypothetical protein
MAAGIAHVASKALRGGDGVDKGGAGIDKKATLLGV